MSSRLTIQYRKKPCYDIVYNHGFQDLILEFEELDMKDRKIAIITDSNVEKLYGEEVRRLFENHCKKVVLYTFPAGECSKTLDTVQKIYTFLIQEKFGRKDLLVALGGGVVGDLTGFVAATYLRGIAFIQIPTTLLSQADSSIGGKTGVDFDAYKNMVGAFYMPKLVYINLSTLKDLDDRQFHAGFAEVMKSALLKDSVFYEWLLANLYEINDRNLTILEEMVLKTDMIKKLIVEKDPTEQGERALLNLGHTIGHAIEKAKNFELLHGECVALGCVAAAFISMKRKLLNPEEYYEIRDMFVPFELPVTVDHIVPAEIVELTKSDKKMEDGKIKFILLKKIGKAIVDYSVTEEELLEAVEEIYYKEEAYYE